LRLAFDIEANGFLDTVSKILCIEAYNVDTDETYSFGPSISDQNKAIDLLKQATVLIGHNIIGYDLPVLKKVWGLEFDATPVDTLVVARLIHSNLKETDSTLVQTGRLAKELYGSNSLKAWGQRIGESKQEYEGGFEEWNQEMQDYCAQDVRTLVKLWRYLKVDQYSQQAIELENDIAKVCIHMERNGWTFDKDKAIDLYAKLAARRDELHAELIAKFGTWEEPAGVLIPKKDNKARGYKAGVPVQKYKTVEFNPNSRRHIEKKLRELGWKPEVFTDGGAAKLDEAILSRIEGPEAQLLVEHFMVVKRLSQIGDGDEGWLKALDANNRIHGRYNTMGTVTGRASHYSPNLGQVPANKKPFGKECRELFTVPKGWVMVGADMQGLELRCLAHYMAYFDDGAYADLVINGDVHTENQQAAGLPTRDNAKTFIYAFLYGAGDAKIGKIVKGTAKDGTRLKQAFMQKFPALKRLRDMVEQSSTKGYLKGLDGRHIPIRSAHAGLNSLLQGCGAILCKRWVVDSFNEVCKKYKPGYEGDFVFCGWIHDELQIACRAEIADDIGNIIVKCAQNAGEPYGFSVRLDSEYIIGANWSETH
jgi:DNA polymerase I-like protein with 3'-5' exonuclease and polymerase domains